MKITKSHLMRIIREELYLIQNAIDHESNFYENMEEDEDDDIIDEQ
tara:strand:+ start:337 stop:474 length:138 start_codon:yes stop_codon:yes gene_type:complete